MAWEYLKTEQFDQRYKIASQIPVNDKIILDINCGEPRFKKYISGYRQYIATDVLTPDDNTDFIRAYDKDINIKCDILCLFGYGGGEYTGEPLESHTIIDSIERLIKHKPEYVVIEMVQKWQDTYGAMDRFKNILKDYEVISETRYDIEPITHYHNQRIICLLKKNT